MKKEVIYVFRGPVIDKFRHHEMSSRIDLTPLLCSPHTSVLTQAL